MTKKKLGDLISVGRILGVLAILSAVIPIPYAIGRVSGDIQFLWAVVCSLLGVTAQALLLVWPEKAFSDYLRVAGAVLLAGAFCLFLGGGVLDIADWSAGVTFWGDATQATSIISYSIGLFCGCLLGIANCYIKK